MNARTDVHWLPGLDPREAAGRLLAYADAGADGVFVPGLTGHRAVRDLVAAVPVPLNVLWAPELSVREAADLGVARVSTGSGPYRHALAAAVASATATRDSRPAEGPPPIAYAALQTLLADGSGGEDPARG